MAGRAGGLTRMARSIQVWLACGSVFVAAAASFALPSGGQACIDWGPFYSRIEATDGSVSRRALGPLFESRSGPGDDAMFALRPLYARATNAASDRVDGDLLWPVGEFSSMNGECDWRVGVAWYRCFDTSAERPRWRLWVLPVYYQGRNAAGENYAALFPLGGRICEFLGRDECQFALWPLWQRTTVDDLESLDILFPLYGIAHGTITERLRLFPFYGRVVQQGSYDKRFILWPIWSSADYHYPGSEGSGYILFPLFGRIDLTDQSTWMVLPPFFRFSRGSRVDRIFAPWPFVQYDRGARSRLHVWPLFGRTSDPGLERSYALWPVLWRSKVYREGLVSRSYWAVPLVFAETLRNRRAAPGEPPEALRWKLWPLASYARHHDEVRFRTLALWPTRDFPCIERSWAPWWTVADYHREGADADTEILWGMFRRQVRGEASVRTSVFPLVEWSAAAPEDAPASREVSLLKGLLGYRWGGVGRELRILYGIRIGLGGPGPSSSTNQTISSRR
jgi:hypothetical protein